MRARSIRISSASFPNSARQARGNGRIVGKAEVDKPLSPVAQQRLKMIGSGVALRFAVLRHNIADVELLRVRSADRIGHPSTRRLGITLVYKLPGPSRIRSAL